MKIRILNYSVLIDKNLDSERKQRNKDPVVY